MIIWFYNMILLSLQQEYLYRDNCRDLLQLVAQKEKAIIPIHLEVKRNTCTWETDSWATVTWMLAAKIGMKCIGWVMLIFLSQYLYKHFTTQSILPITQRNHFNCKWNCGAISRMEFRNMLTSHRKKKGKRKEKKIWKKLNSFKPEEYHRGFQAAWKSCGNLTA